jgi:uncharacterized membrane protein (DUF106 family)
MITKKQKVIDSLKTIINDNVTAVTLQKSHELYNTSFNNMQTSFNLFVLIAGILVGFFSYVNSKHIEDIKKDIKDELKESKEQIENQKQNITELKNKIKNHEEDLEKLKGHPTAKYNWKYESPKQGFFT